MKIYKFQIILLFLAITIFSCKRDKVAFSYAMPEEKPDMPLSSAVERIYDAYMGIRPETNELYSQFRYTKLQGLDYNSGDGTISRRDPSKVIFANGKFYMYYTHRETPVAPIGMHRADESNDTIPTAD